MVGAGLSFDDFDNVSVHCLINHFIFHLRKTSCSFVMRLPNRLERSTEVLFVKAFFAYLWYYQGVLSLETTIKNTSDQRSEVFAMKLYNSL